MTIKWKYNLLKTHVEVKSAEEELRKATQRLAQARTLLNKAKNDALTELLARGVSGDGIVPLDDNTFLLILRNGEETDMQIKEALDDQ